jgi:hypothetical protein
LRYLIVPVRFWISVTNRRYNARRKTVLTCRKSQARMPEARAAGNCLRPVTPGAVRA